MYIHFSLSVKVDLLAIHITVTAGAAFCIIKNLNTDELLNITGTFTSTLIAYIFPFKFFLSTFSKSHTPRGRRFILLIKVLYYSFWLFQIAAVVSLFISAANR